MISFLRNSFREFSRKYLALAVLGILLLILVSAQLYYRWALTNPFMQPIVVGTQEGWSIDSIENARIQIYEEKFHVKIH